MGEEKELTLKEDIESVYEELNENLATVWQAVQTLENRVKKLERHKHDNDGEVMVRL